MAELHLDLVTPEKLVFSGPATEILVPGFEGEFGVLPGHTIYLSLLRPGIATVFGASGTRRFVVGRGFAEAGPERVVLLTDSCEPAEAVDKAAAQKALVAAESVLEKAEPDTEAWAQARLQADMASARLQA